MSADAGQETTSARRRQSLPADARRAAIIESTIPLLAARGPAATTAQIARAAGVAQGTIFHVFGDKQQLIDATVQHLMDVEPLLGELEVLHAERALRPRMAHCADVLIADLVRSMPVIMKCGMPAGNAAKGHLSARTQEAIAGLLQPDADRLSRPIGELASVFFFLCIAAAQQSVLGDAQPTSGDDIADLFLDGARLRRRR